MSVSKPVDHPNPDAGAGQPPATTQDLARVAWASALGSALEYYDFALYSLASALIFSQLFFTATNPTTALILSFATYFVGFAVRPVGGLVFGSLGDRIGRKSVLMITVLMMGVGSTLIGALPTYSQVGIWAPILLVVLRVVQGLGAGAEQAGAAIMMTEFAPRRRRGLFASLPFLGIQAGTLLAAGVFFLLLRVNKDVLHGWLWRVPFLASALLIVVALWIRFRMKESPTFTALQTEHHVENKPLRNLLRTSRRNLLIGFCLRMAENGGSSIYQTLSISYVVTVALAGIKSPGPIGPLALVGASVVSAFVVPLAGVLSDRFGRVPTYRGFAIFQLVLAVPTWWIMSTGNVPATIAAISVALGVGSWGMFGASGAFLPELFGNKHRYIGVSTAREFSAVVAGGLAPLIGALLLGWFNKSWIPLALYTIFLTVITLAATFFAPETRGRDLTIDADAGQPGDRLAEADLVH